MKIFVKPKTNKKDQGNPGQIGKARENSPLNTSRLPGPRLALLLAPSHQAAYRTPSPSQCHMSYFRVSPKTAAVPPRSKQSLSSVFTRNDPRHDVRLKQATPTRISVIPTRKDSRQPKIINRHWQRTTMHNKRPTRAQPTRESQFCLRFTELLPNSPNSPCVDIVQQLYLLYLQQSIA